MCAASAVSPRDACGRAGRPATRDAACRHGLVKAGGSIISSKQSLTEQSGLFMIFIIFSPKLSDGATGSISSNTQISNDKPRIYKGS